MLQALDPAHRLAYILGEVLELSSELAAEIAEVGVTELLELTALARVFRAHPRYRADPAIVAELRERIAATVFGAGEPS